MTSPTKRDTKDGQCACTVRISPAEVDAGAEVTLKVGVTDLHPGTSQPGVSVRDDQGGELARAELRKSQGGDWEPDDIVLNAPRDVGEHIYCVVVVGAGKDGESREHASAEARFVVKPHAAQLNVWDVPSTVVASERFKFMAGLRCSAGCGLAGEGLRLVDGEGREIACADLGHSVWPGTDALYFAEVEAEAPPSAGDYQWEIKTAASTSDLPHAAGSHVFGIKVVSPPNCQVTIQVVDSETQAPIKEARVVMHPYRAISDENGTAKLKVTEGRYNLLVSASKYRALSTVAEVKADVVRTVELDADPPWDPMDEV
jgi:hypothetical protein